MKKIRVTLKQEIVEPKVILRMFPDSESVYVWACDHEAVQPTVVDLEKDEFIEIEWLGFEVASRNSDMKFHLVRAVRGLNVGKTDELVIDPFYGWIPDKEVGFFDYDNDSVHVVRINAEMSNVDMASVFTST